MLNQLFSAILKSFKYLFGYFLKMFLLLYKKADGLGLKTLLTDFLGVIQNTIVLIILETIALLIFTVLPQGRDVLLIVIEEIILEHTFWNFFFLLIGLIFWSVMSEFSGRYSIYVNDNSGRNLSNERVEWRKAVQAVMANIFLLIPYFIVLTGFLVCFLTDKSLSDSEKNIGIGIPALIIYAVMNIAAILYDRDAEKLVINESLRNELNSENKTSDKEWFNKFRMLVWEIRDFVRGKNQMILYKKEKEWCEKLYGIYNDFTFQVRRKENFENSESENVIYNSYRNFTDILDNLEETEFNNLPQNSSFMSGNTVLPNSFELLNNPFGEKSNNPKDDRYLWLYRIPNSFYKNLHTELILGVSISMAIFIVVSFLPVSIYQRIGAPSLLMLAFASLTGIYLGIMYLDYAIFRKRAKKGFYFPAFIPLRVILLLLLIVCSYINTDHEVRKNNFGVRNERPKLKEHFTSWLHNYVQDSINTKYVDIKDSTKSFYPVVFVCAEGGALRTGAYSSMMLGMIQDTLAKAKGKHRINFKETIYAFSSVSGGSLGLGFFNAIAYLNPQKNLIQDSSFLSLSSTYYKGNFLAPIIGKMFFGDIINLFLPVRIERFDRAIALEMSWENSFNRILKNKGFHFSDDFLSIYPKNHIHPAYFINTTEVETGLQCWISNVEMEDDRFDKDILRTTLNKHGINYSTAINFSSRFPIFSPAANVIENETLKRHYVDGGYVENTGAATMSEILEALKPIIKNNNRNVKIKPYVIMLRYSEENGKTNHSNINLGNEITEILFGIYNTRSGRTIEAVESLKTLTKKEFDGVFIELCLDNNGNDVPMNWVLSEKALRKMETSVKNDFKKLDTLFCLDSNNVRKRY